MLRCSTAVCWTAPIPTSRTTSADPPDFSHNPLQTHIWSYYHTTNPYAFYANKKSTAQFPAFCLFTDKEIRRTLSPLTWFLKFSPDIQHSPFPTVTLTSPLVIGNIDMSVGNSSKKNLREHYPILNHTSREGPLG